MYPWYGIAVGLMGLSRAKFIRYLDDPDARTGDEVDLVQAFDSWAGVYWWSVKDARQALHVYDAYRWRMFDRGAEKTWDRLEVNGVDVTNEFRDVLFLTDCDARTVANIAGVLAPNTRGADHAVRVVSGFDVRELRGTDLVITL
jgi:hypothetical protein